MKVDSWKKFKEIDNYFKEKNIFIEISVIKPYYIGKGRTEIIKRYAVIIVKLFWNLYIMFFLQMKKLKIFSW